MREDNSGAIVWPTVDAEGVLSPRRRRLGESSGPKTRGGSGRSLGVWWPRGRPACVSGPGGLGDVICAEGESDALAAVTALGSYPAAVASIPGASFPAGRLAVELRAVGATVAALAFDGDMAGGMAADRIAHDLAAAGIGARILAIPHGEDLASVLARVENPRRWLAHALVSARPVALTEAALTAENEWLRAMLMRRQPGMGDLQVAGPY